MQEKILEFLNANRGEKYSIGELSLYLTIKKSIYTNIKKLLKNGDIQTQEVIGKDKRHTYSIYYIERRKNDN